MWRGGPGFPSHARGLWQLWKPHPRPGAAAPRECLLRPGSHHPRLHPPSLAHAAVIAELGGGEGTILILSDSKLNFPFLSRHLLLAQKSKVEAGGILLNGKAQGCYF